MHDKITAVIFLLLLAGAMLYAHMAETARREMIRLEQQRLDRAGVIGWTRYDPDAMQFVYTERR